MKYTFPKTVRLHLRNEVAQVFAQGQSIFQFPFRAVFMIVEKPNPESPFQVLLNVSKRKFKRAVDRNTVKRKMRESFRLQQEVLQKISVDTQHQLLIAIMYIDAKHNDYEVYHKSMHKLLQKMVDKNLKSTPE